MSFISLTRHQLSLKTQHGPNEIKRSKKERKRLNNTNLKRLAADPQPRFGCKEKSKFWFGYKGHVGVDMGFGFIKSAAFTPANIFDQAGFKHICPRGGEVVFGDKAYCLKPAQIAMKVCRAISAAILKHNMISKNKDLDRWYSSVRTTFEGIFSKCKKRARYLGIAKVQFQFFMDTIVHHVKCLVTINSPSLFVDAQSRPAVNCAWNYHFTQYDQHLEIISLFLTLF